MLWNKNECGQRLSSYHSTHTCVAPIPKQKEVEQITADGNKILIIPSLTYEYNV
jgi:hypothetical protein